MRARAVDGPGGFRPLSNGVQAAGPEGALEGEDGGGFEGGVQAGGPEGVTMAGVGLDAEGGSFGFGQGASPLEHGPQREALMLDVGDFVGGLKGLVLATGCGGGMAPEDRDLLAAATAFTTGLGSSIPGGERSLGRDDLAVVTAAGTIAALQAAAYAAADAALNEGSPNRIENGDTGILG